MRELLELLEHDARRPVSEIAPMLGKSEYEVEQDIRRLEKDKVILSYNTLINWEKFGDNTVTAIIEVNLMPQREVGVTQTRSHFMLKAYKKDGIVINDEERDRRLVVTP